jgi:pilus assembly protein CpaE
MRAGAREFLTLPLDQSVLMDALDRAFARCCAARPLPPKSRAGRLLAFLGAKGGDGVTTLACNFAVSLAQESKESTVLIDLNLPLGDAGLNLGTTAEYSTINALQNASRLDSKFLSTLLVKHSSGVSVLAAPGKFPDFEADDKAIDQLIAVARQDFDNVVIDMGSRLDLTTTSLFKEGATIYLVIQVGVAGLRNADRLISQYFTTGIPKLEIVLNRFQKDSMGVGEDEITKALAGPIRWKIPSDFFAVRRMQRTAIPLVAEDSQISHVIRQMARAACGLEDPEKEKKPGFSFKKIGNGLWTKLFALEKTPAIASLGSEVEPDEIGTAFGAKQADDRAGIPEKSVDFPNRPAEPETRTYNGATYARAADGQWHLLKTPKPDVNPVALAVALPQPVSKPKPARKTASPKSPATRKAKSAKAVAKAPEKKPKTPAKRKVKVAEKRLAPEAQGSAKPTEAVRKPSAKAAAYVSTPADKKSVSASSPKAAKPKRAARKHITKALESQPIPESAADPSVSESAQQD